MDYAENKTCTFQNGVSGSFIFGDGMTEDILYNNGGDEINAGMNYRVDASYGMCLGSVVISIMPELRMPSDETLTFKTIYAGYRFDSAQLIVGRYPMWWGPGRHGALLMSTNAEPLNSIGISNIHPITLPWIFKHAGAVDFEAFLSRLEKRRAIPEPFFWGYSFDISPFSWINAGLHRTALLGGRGKPDDINVWIRSFTAWEVDDQGTEGDQRAGFFVTLKPKIKDFKPEFYLEASGEDEAGGFPDVWAYLTGIYMHDLLRGAALRMEYANNHVEGMPNVWYTNHEYRTGYTYNGRIIGHHMGTDSEDLYIGIESEGQGWSARVSYDIERHGLSSPVKQFKHEASAILKWDLNSNTSAFVSMGFADTSGDVENGGYGLLFTASIERAF